MTCGCYIETFQKKIGEIIFCPLHAAADQMLSMLQHIEIHGLRGTGYADLKDLITRAEATL